MSRRPSRAAVAALVSLAATAALLTGCSSDGSSSAAATTSAGASPSTSPTTEPDPAETTPATVAPPLPQPVSSVGKVKRQGQVGTPTVTAPGAKFSQAVAYPDGVKLTIVKAEKAVETGHGPGVMAGRDYVRFELRLSNGSTKPINLDQVVITTFYGSSRQLAAPVYTESAGTGDFYGTVKPGGTASALYAFAVPAKELGKVTMVVDFDGVHTSATYSGAVVTS